MQRTTSTVLSRAHRCRTQPCTARAARTHHLPPRPCGRTLWSIAHSLHCSAAPPLAPAGTRQAGRRGQDQGVLWVLSAGGPCAPVAGSCGAWHTHRRLVQRVKSADDRSNVRCGAGSAACVRSATCRMQAGNSLMCQHCQQVSLHVTAQRVLRRRTGVAGYYRAQYPVGVHLVPCQGEVSGHCGACMAQPSASAHAHFQAPRRTRAVVLHAAARCVVHVACGSSHACMPHVWALGWCAGPLACCTSCVVYCVLRAAGCALRVARYTLDGVCCIIACCMLLQRCGSAHTASWSRERSKGIGIQGRWAAETPRRDLPQDGK
jgi:hypothetical protein